MGRGRFSWSGEDDHQLIFVYGLSVVYLTLLVSFTAGWERGGERYKHIVQRTWLNVGKFPTPGRHLAVLSPTLSPDSVITAIRGRVGSQRTAKIGSQLQSCKVPNQAWPSLVLFSFPGPGHILIARPHTRGQQAWVWVVQADCSAWTQRKTIDPRIHVALVSSYHGHAQEDISWIPIESAENRMLT